MLKFLLQSRFNLGMARDQVPGPGQRICRGAPPRKKERDHFVADLPVGDSNSRSAVNCCTQDEKQVAPRPRRVPPSADERTDDCVKASQNPPFAKITTSGYRRRKPQP